jgi:hypothetical protein
VDEYHQQAQQRPASQLTPAEKAAKLLQWVRTAQAEAPEKVLQVLGTAQQKASEAGVLDLEVDGAPLRMHIQVALQNTNAAIQAKAASAGAQGVTRQEQQSGQGGRAAVPQHPVEEPTEADLQDALAILARGDVPDDVVENAQQTVYNYDAAQG